MKTKHTPAPWEIVDQREMPDGHLLVVSPYDGSIASITKSGGEASCLDADANARLIAATPDLLAALLKMDYLHCASGDAKPEDHPAYAWAEAAIEDPEGNGSWRGESTSAMLNRLATAEVRAAIAKTEGK